MSDTHTAVADLVSEPVLDRAALAVARADAGEALFAELVGMFDAEQGRRVVMLRAALAADDRTGIVFQAHVLRSAGSQLAATRLAAIAAQLEREAKVAGPMRLHRLVGEVIDLAASSFAALRESVRGG